MSALRSLVDANVRLSARVSPRLESSNLFIAAFDERVAREANALGGGALIADVGGGRRCAFAAAVDRGRGARIVAVDSSAAELAANADVDERRTADAAGSLPFADGEVDLLVSRAVLEHVDGVAAAAREMHRALAPGGRTLHLASCRYALFAIGARLLPQRLLLRALHALVPATRGVVEFDVFYDHCHPRALERVFADAGFHDVQVRCCWSQTDYFTPCFPVFLLVAAYQELARALGLRTLAAYVVLSATR